MISEGKLSGKRKKFPIIVKEIHGRILKETKIENLDELIKLYDKKENSPDSLVISKDGKSKKKKTWQILEEMGVSGMQMIDYRTEMILEEYLFYQKAPHQAPYDCALWKKSVIILNNILQPGLF